MSNIAPTRCQIIADGEKLGLILPGQGIVVIDNPLIKNFSVQDDYHDIYAEGIAMPIRKFLIDREFELRFSGENLKVGGMDCSLFDFDFFRNMTIRDLFAEIQKKIGRR